MSDWKIKNKKYLVDNPWIKVREDEVQRGTNKFNYYVVEENDGGMIGALNDKNELLFVKHYKPAIDKEVLELPSGYFEKIDQTLQEAMKRELLEETGYYAKKLTKSGNTYRSPGRYTQKVHLYLAQDLNKQQQKLDDIEKLEVVPIEISKAIKMIDSGEIKDLATIATILLIQRELKR